MNKIGKTFVKYLGDKIKQRLVVESSDLFEMMNNMGITDDSETVIDIMEHLDENNIDVHFKEGDQENHRRFKIMKQQFRIFTDLKVRRKRSVELIKKMDEIKIKPQGEWLEQYRNSDSEEEFKPGYNNGPETNPELDELNQRIKNQVFEEMKERLNKMTDEERFEHAINQIENIRNQINNNQ